MTIEPSDALIWSMVLFSAGAFAVAFLVAMFVEPYTRK